MHDFDADCVDVVVHIGFFARYAHRAHRWMRQQCPRYVIDQSFLQVDMPLFYAMLDREPKLT